MGLFGNAPDAVTTMRLESIERKLDTILTSLGIEIPPPAYGPAGTALQPDAVEEIRALARAGKKIEAIKRLRDITGVGLKDAKELIESGL